MDRHCSNSLAVAQYLSGHPNVEWVRYPGLPGDAMYDLNHKYLQGKGGGMVVFGCKGGREASARFIDSLGLVSHVANVGDAKTLAINPATTTHSQLSEEELRAGGVPPELVRLSVGIENVKDIIRDIEQALQLSATPSMPHSQLETFPGLRENRRIPMFPRQAVIGGRLFQYNVFGQITKSGTQRPPIIAVCGWGMVKEEWGKLPFELSAAQEVLTFDNQGLGGSVDNPDDPFTLQSWCDDVVALADEAFGAGVQFNVMGYSMGAFAAQHLAARRADRVLAAVLIGAQGDRKTAVAGAGAFFKLAGKTMPDGQNSYKDNEERLKYFFDKDVIRAEDPKDWEAVIRQSLRFKRPAATIKKQLKVLGSAGVPLDQITCPVLVMTGERDTVVPAENGKLVLQQLTNASRKELVVVPNQGHQCYGMCPPKRQLSFRARDTPTATHLVARHIQNFLSGSAAGHASDAAVSKL